MVSVVVIVKIEVENHNFIVSLILMYLKIDQFLQVYASIPTYMNISGSFLIMMEILSVKSPIDDLICGIMYL